MSILNMSDAAFVNYLRTCLICWLSDICLFIIAHIHCVDLLPVSIPNYTIRFIVSDIMFVKYMSIYYCTHSLCGFITSVNA